MNLKDYFIPILKETPSEASVKSHILMLRAGMIRQQNAGIYYWLPLGLKILKKLEAIIRVHMEEIGFIEVLMPCVQPASLWKESGRYDSYGNEMLKIIDRHENEMLFGPTNEENFTDIIRKNIFSYKDLPKNLYQIQWKFRDEIRPRFGVMRGREFLMKDAYSFDLDEEASEKTYQTIFTTYQKIFKSMGLATIPVKAETGEIGGDLSHEFHLLSESGESKIFYDKDYINKSQNVSFDELIKIYAVAEEKYVEGSIDPNLVCSSRSIEIGHIFCFGQKYTKAMNAAVQTKEGNKIYPYCGSYGIGVSRLIGAIIESSHDEKGIIWPKEVSPFDVSLINLHPADSTSSELCNKIYQSLKSKKIEVLYDDSTHTIGAKFATHDLLGFPTQIIVGAQNASKDIIEIKDRKTGEITSVSFEQLEKKDRF
jgi:prolyl-tRNA synthetase